MTKRLNKTSRTLSAKGRNFEQLVTLPSKPVLDSETNMAAQVEIERMQTLIRSHMPSGVIMDPLDSTSYFDTATERSNWFGMERMWVNVNGWVFPVTGTRQPEGNDTNRIDLFPPPSSDTRMDFVFLEVWIAQVAPYPSDENKPSPATLYPHGNVLFGGDPLQDDLIDPAVGIPTSERVQVQYRLRVFGSGSGAGSSIALDVYPDGMDDPNVYAQGTSTSPIPGVTFENMKDELDDPGLWRAGDGDPDNNLGTVDGYVYAIPVCAVARRNTGSWVGRTSGGAPNLPGSFDRNPVAGVSSPVEASSTLGTVTLLNDLGPDATGVVQIDGLLGSGIDNPNHDWDNTFLVLGDEIVGISGVDANASPMTMTLTSRGRWGTQSTLHEEGTPVRFFNSRPDGRWADEIHPMDILDLRKAVNMGDWDYQRLLQHNVTRLFRGDLRSTWKVSGQGQTLGVYLTEVSELRASGTPATGTEKVDGPDGIRTIFSDAATLQTDVTTILNPDATQTAGQQVADFTQGATWGIGANISPAGFMVEAGEWRNNTTVFIYVAEARNSLGGERNVRFVTPKEYDLLTPEEASLGNTRPLTLHFMGEAWSRPAAGSEGLQDHPGPMYPTRETNYEHPFIVLGGILHPDLQITTGAAVNPDDDTPTELEVEFSGLDFDAPGVFWNGSAFDNDVSGISTPLLNGTRTLYDMITNGGKDRTGQSSELYLVLWGDTNTDLNNGAFQVVGAGTVGYTLENATGPNRLVLRALNPDFTAFVNATGLNAEFRSQYSTMQDGEGAGSGISALCLVMTDVEGDTQSGKWAASSEFDPGPREGKVVVHTTLQYGPGHGAMRRIPQELMRLASSTLTTEAGYLRQSRAEGDNTFVSLAGLAPGEVYWPWNHVQTWNRLSSLGMAAPYAPAYGGAKVSFSEQDRDAEVFVDLGSKTMLLRPLQSKNLTLVEQEVEGSLMPNEIQTGRPVDPLNIFVATRDTGYSLPAEIMPRFGRQDIPFYRDLNAGSGAFLNGINHLFVDAITATQQQFNIIGGLDSGGAGVNPFYFYTGASYGAQDSVSGRQGMVARYHEDKAVLSTDIEPGLRGIELPPFYGVSRVYGVYERAAFESVGGDVFAADRITPTNTSTAPNLLRRDADKQTLFIRQGGAEDVTGNADDHTYILPEQALDLTRAASYDPAKTLQEYDLVVVCTVFGFSRGFINRNHMVLKRRNNGGGVSDPELDAVRMLVHAPFTQGSILHAAYNRTPYQGDPYMTRGVSSRVTNDYANRYGRIPQADAFGLSDPIQQFDSEGNFIPETPNARAFQVLASMDFYTTLGTGSIGGPLYPGTVTDVGHVSDTPSSSTRVPNAPSDIPWDVQARAFTSGQTPLSNRARLEIQLSDVQAGEILTVGATDFEAGTDFSVSDMGTAAQELADAINNAGEPVQAQATFYNASSSASGLTLVSTYPGAAGNLTPVSTEAPGSFLLGDRRTDTTLQGGLDLPVNGGSGMTPVSLTGVTERLPLGILLQDSDFMGEDPVRDSTGQLFSGLGLLSADGMVPLPLSEGGVEYSRLVGPGQYLGMSDGSILSYAAYDEALRPTGSTRFRLYRGGGPLWVASGDRPGGPVDWVSSSFPESQMPVLKGGILVGRALLVRTYHETAFESNMTVNHGGEIQMVVMTRGILGDGRTQDTGVSLSGFLSPSGYGEGFAAADRYRLEGKPMMSSQGIPVDPNVELAPFPFEDLTVNLCVC